MTTVPAWSAQLSALGPYFAVHHHPAGAVVPPWLTFADLIEDPAVLRDRVDAIRHGLATMGGLPDDAIETRVAASVAQLGITSRLVSPALAVAAGTGIVLGLEPGETWWQPVPGGPVPVSIRVPQARAPAPDAVAGLAGLLDGPVRALADAFARLSVSRRTVWGNVASAVHGAAAVLDRERPEWTERTHGLIAALRRREPLAGTGDVDARGRFRRRSCCLIYRAAPDRSGPLCGDCVLAAARS